MRRAGHTLTIGEMLDVASHHLFVLGTERHTPITVNDVPVDEAEWRGDRFNLIQERTNVVPASAVISMITEVLSVSRSKKVADIMQNFGEEYGLI